MWRADLYTAHYVIEHALVKPARSIGGEVKVEVRSRFTLYTAADFVRVSM